MSIDYSILPLPKLSKEQGRLARRAAKDAIKARETAEKAKVVRRDGLHYCRLVPGCQEREHHETAHLENKGMGGDHGQRTSADTMVRACFAHHQGDFSLHSRDLKVEYLTPERANGPIAVWALNRAAGEWYCLGRETAVGAWERD